VSAVRFRAGKTRNDIFLSWGTDREEIRKTADRLNKMGLAVLTIVVIAGAGACFAATNHLAEGCGVSRS